VGAEFVEGPPAVAVDVLRLELSLGERAADGEGLGADQEIVVDDAVVAGSVALGNDFLVPQLRWVVGAVQADLLEELAAQALDRRLAVLDPAAGSRPDRAGAELEADQQNAVVQIEDDATGSRP
jgi:hypothetical protein